MASPVSFYYCHDAGRKSIRATHNRTLDASNQRGDTAAKRYTAAKVMHVSPFMDIALQSDWIFTEPGERLVAEHGIDMARAQKGNFAR